MTSVERETPDRQARPRAGTRPGARRGRGVGAGDFVFVAEPAHRPVREPDALEHVIEHHAPADRRRQRGDEQAVIPPRHDASNRAGGVAAEAVRDQPFASRARRAEHRRGCGIRLVRERSSSRRRARAAAARLIPPAAATPVRSAAVARRRRRRRCCRCSTAPPTTSRRAAPAMVPAPARDRCRAPRFTTRMRLSSPSPS